MQWYGRLKGVGVGGGLKWYTAAIPLKWKKRLKRNEKGRQGRVLQQQWRQPARRYPAATVADGCCQGS